MITVSLNTKQIVKRKRMKITGDTSRVITLPHIPSKISRISNIIKEVLKLSADEAEQQLEETLLLFADRHRDLEELLMRHYDRVSEYVIKKETISKTQKLLIGAFFTMEYSIESAALFNPSIVPHPDQSLLPKGSMRFIMSLRATGEGHISSIVFRSGILNKKLAFNFDSVSEYVETPKMVFDPTYNNNLFQLKLKDLNAWNETSEKILTSLPDNFTHQELRESIRAIFLDTNFSADSWTTTTIHWLADSNYRIRFDDETALSERVIYPISANESKGIEDARFVKFTHDNGKVMYYATYTAYNGRRVLSQMIETHDFQTFNMITLNGKGVRNKGMALFPRKVNGKYAMLSRQDGENNYVIFSDDLHFWGDGTLIQKPEQPWEFVQIGNCGSPIETDKGWIVMTHGVGNMRQYSIGVILLDLEDPTKVIAKLEEPLMTANDEEREGYVPNVIYSCGSMLVDDKLIIPYAMSDVASRIAIVDVNDLFARMKFVDE
ncbi:MAG TPA: glycoside hydrolase family 130 protein [Dysgonamonadaceae bacterium]|nr:glycoside hydrolase family 130 protein [Dysgonamonadaceae bacterium]